MTEIIEMPSGGETSPAEPTPEGAGLFAGDQYKEHRAQIENFLSGKEEEFTPNKHSELQARSEAKKAGIEELPDEAVRLYVFLRGLPTGLSDQVLFDEVLRLTNSNKRGTFRKFYPSAFPESGAEPEETDLEPREEPRKAA